jgi:hypothetical protein
MKRANATEGIQTICLLMDIGPDVVLCGFYWQDMAEK